MQLTGRNVCFSILKLTGMLRLENKNMTPSDALSLLTQIFNAAHRTLKEWDIATLRWMGQQALQGNWRGWPWAG